MTKQFSTKEMSTTEASALWDEATRAIRVVGSDFWGCAGRHTTSFHNKQLTPEEISPYLDEHTIVDTMQREEGTPGAPRFKKAASGSAQTLPLSRCEQIGRGVHPHRWRDPNGGLVLVGGSTICVFSLCNCKLFGSVRFDPWNKCLIRIPPFVNPPFGSSQHRSTCMITRRQSEAAARAAIGNVCDYGLRQGLAVVSSSGSSQVKRCSCRGLQY